MLASTAVYVVIALALANLAGLAWLARTIRAGGGGVATDLAARFDAIERNHEALRSSLAEMDRGLRGEIAAGTRDGLAAGFKAHSEALANVQQALNQLADALRGGLDGFAQRLRDEQELLRSRVGEKLDEIRTGNEAKLEQMRLTVDEKLQATLERRLGASFKQVSDSLEQVYKSVGEMQALAVGVGDLKRVLTNIKARGTWTEIDLENMLAQVLAPDQYGRNIEVLPGSNQRVEFAIRLPGDDETPVWLPIDVKFPTADYERLALAAERGDQAEVELMARAVESRIREAARDISTKYIQPPHSTDFAVMYLPTEGLFAEIVRRPGLIDAMQRECRIMVAGPTTLVTLLTALRMGFRSLAIQRRSAEVWRVLGAVKHEFGKFGAVIDRVGRKLDEAQKVLDDEVGVRRRAMERRLRAVETLPEAEAAALLEYDADGDDEPRAAAE